MEFVGRCWRLIRDSSGLRADLEVENWKSVIGILQVVERERLFVAYSIRGMHTDVTEGSNGEGLALWEARDKAVEVLEMVDTSKGKSVA